MSTNEPLPTLDEITEELNETLASESRWMWLFLVIGLVVVSVLLLVVAYFDSTPAAVAASAWVICLCLFLVGREVVYAVLRHACITEAWSRALGGGIWMEIRDSRASRDS
jgi:hypothetical protein